MLIEIQADVFSKASFAGLNYLLQLCFYKQRYEVFIDFNKVYKSEAFKQLSQIDQKVIEENFNEVVLGVEKKPDLVISEKNNNYFNINESLRYLSQPVSIILENSLNDAYFIKAIFKHFSKAKKIIEHLENGWIQFENAGGCSNLSNFLEGKKQSYNALPKENYSYLRCFVILDSDKKHPQDIQKPQYTTLVNTYSNQNVKIHILEKRSMENYLPLEVYRYIINKTTSNFTNAFISMTPSQVDFYNLHKGFEVDKLGDLSQQVANHYASVSSENFSRLSAGFALADFKSEFPKLMEHQAVHKESLLNRTSHQINPDELQTIVNQIESLL